MKVRYPLATLVIAFAAAGAAQNLGPWPQHALDRPQPPVVMPAPADKPAAPPADAVIIPAIPRPERDDWGTSMSFAQVGH